MLSYNTKTHRMCDLCLYAGSSNSRSCHWAIFFRLCTRGSCCSTWCFPCCCLCRRRRCCCQCCCLFTTDPISVAAASASASVDLLVSAAAAAAAAAPAAAQSLLLRPMLAPHLLLILLALLQLLLLPQQRPSRMGPLLDLLGPYARHRGCCCPNVTPTWVLGCPRLYS